MAIFDNLPYSNLHELNLDWILRLMKCLDTSMDNLKKQVADQLEEMGVDIDKIQDWISQFDEEQFLEEIHKIVDSYVTSGVYFGLTKSGYFVAYIPGGWSEIQFGTTGLDIFPPEEPEYGHLTLSY